MQLQTIRVKWNTKSLAYVQILFILVMLWLRDVLHFPSAISYITDVVLVCMLIQGFRQNPNLRILKDTLPQFIIVCCILLFMLFGVAINGVNPLLVLWGMRNNLRFFIFFFICVNRLDRSDVTNLLRLFKKFYWANLVMCFIQYYGFGLKADYLGGFFGTVRGCNAYLNVFLCIVCADVIADFFTYKRKGAMLALYLCTAVYIAFLAELKVFYFELPLMLALVVIFSKPSLKTISITIICAVGFWIGLLALAAYDPKTFGVLLDADALEMYLAGGGYTNSGDLNRFTAINQISNTFFSGSPLRTLFGFGLGGCEYSQFSFLQSEFALQHGGLNYRWFTHAWVYLEQGAVGLILLLLFFVSLLIYACRRAKKSNKSHMAIAIAFLPTCLLGLLYNTVIQIECCYIIAFACAIPYIMNKSGTEQEARE